MNFLANPRLKRFSFVWVLLSGTLLSAYLYSATAFAVNDAEQIPQGAVTPEPIISEAELAQTLAPIALYPDTLLTHILIGATYPMEVIAADRWLNKYSDLTALQINEKSAEKEWDASIKALLPFPRVLAKLSEDLTWMQKLGDAFLQDEARVLASIQTLRLQAEQAGSLTNMDNVRIVKEQQVIIIEPAQPEIIYVPYYDTRVVYGRWHWSHYPPVYWHHPHYYAAHYGHFYWGHGVHISSHFFFSAFHWHKRYVVVNHYNRHSYHPRKKIVISHHAKRWHHQPKHRRGVAYSSSKLNKKYYARSANVHGSKAIRKTAISSGKNKANASHIRNSNVHVSHVKKNKSVKHNKKPVVISNHYKAKQTKDARKATQNKATKNSSVYHYPVSRQSPKTFSKQGSNKVAKHFTKKPRVHATKYSPKRSSRQSTTRTVTSSKQHRSKHH